MREFKLVYFRGCPNVDRARELLKLAGITNVREVTQDDLAEGESLKQLSSPSIVSPAGAVLYGEKCGSGACTFGPDEDVLNCLKEAARSPGRVVAPLLGTGSSLGLLALIGTCGGTCSVLAFPLAGVLGSLGLSALVPWLPMLRYPLLAVAVSLAILSLIRIRKMRRPWISAAAGMCLVIVISVSFASSQPKSAEPFKGTAYYLKTLTPETQEVVKNGIYRTWIRLGHAPSQADVRAALGSESAGKVERAYEELLSSGFAEVFIPGTRELLWFWPLSTKNHGVEVTLKGEKPVFARCAVDALGMSQMFGKPSMISIRTPLLKKQIQFSMNGSTLTEFDSSVVVSKGNGCDDLLFFSSAEEFARFKEKSGRKQLKMMTLSEAVSWGLASFGSIFQG